MGTYWYPANQTGSQRHSSRARHHSRGQCWSRVWEPLPLRPGCYIVFIVSLYYPEKRRRVGGSLWQGPTVFLYWLCKCVRVPQFSYLIWKLNPLWLDNDQNSTMSSSARQTIPKMYWELLCEGRWVFSARIDFSEWNQTTAMKLLQFPLCQGLTTLSRGHCFSCLK